MSTICWYVCYPWQSREDTAIVLFICLFVCLFVCAKDNLKSCLRIGMKFSVYDDIGLTLRCLHFGPSTMKGRCPPKGQNLVWRFGNEWHCSRATKLGVITVMPRGRFLGCQTNPYTQSGFLDLEPKYFHTCNLYTPAVVTRATGTKFGMVTYNDYSKNFRGRPIPS